jgi:hypothetical protein
MWTTYILKRAEENFYVGRIGSQKSVPSIQKKIQPWQQAQLDQGWFGK